MSSAQISPSQERRSPFACMSATDWGLVCLLSAFLFALCAVRSRSRLLWADELYGYRVLGSPSIRGMLRGWYQGADGGGLFYYLLGRLWVDAFGLSALTLRLFSTLGMAAAMALNWTALRRYVCTFAAAVSIGVVYLTPAVMLWQELNGRFYGLFLAFAALASLWFLVTAEREPTRSDLVITTLAHACLIGSHILGLVYSFGLIAGGLTLDDWRKRPRWKLHLAEAAGWLMIPVSYHAMRSSSSVATDVFWTRRPDLAQLLLGFAIFGTVTVYLLAGVLVLAVLHRFLSRQTVPSMRQTEYLAPVFLIGSLVLAQAILFIKSQTGISVYSDRYLIPIGIGTALGFAIALQSLLSKAIRQPRSRGFGLSFSLFALIPFFAFALSRQTNFALYPPTGYTQKLAAMIPRDAPVLTNLPAFTLLSTYDPTHHYLFMLDWSYDLQPSQHRDVSGERLMENWKRAGYEAGNILPCTSIFSRYPDNYVLLAPYRGSWFEDRLLHNPAYSVQQLAVSTQWQYLTLWRVHRVGAGSLPC